MYGRSGNKRMLFLHPDAQARDLLLERFAAMGVMPGRIELASYVANQEGHLAAYGKVDVALDTYPCANSFERWSYR